MALAASVSGYQNQFAQDDVPIIEQDTRVHSFDSLGTIFRSAYWPPPALPNLYRPLATSSFALQWVIGGGDPVVFRVTSYLIYILTSALVYVLARQLLTPGAALGVGVLFAAHPVHVEAVALAVNQGEQLVALAAVASLIFYLGRRQGGWLHPRDWAVLAAVYVTACLFKEHALVIPGLLLAAELTLLRTAPFGLGDRVRNLLPGYSVILALGVAFMIVRTRILDDFAGTFTAEALVGQGVFGRTLTMLQVVPKWLGLLLWPSHLQGDYSPSVILQADSFGWAQGLGAFLLVAFLALATLMWTRAPVASFAILFMGVALLPVSNILVPTGIVLAERTLFLASVGMVLLAGSLTDYFLSQRKSPTLAGRVLATGCAILVILGVWRSAVRHPDWRNQLHYWARTVEDAPLSYRAHHANAQLLWALGYEGASIASFHTAMALYPRAWWIRNELANRFRRKGECYPALELYEESLRWNPDQSEARASSIACLTFVGRYDDAIAAIDSALARTPSALELLAYRATADSARSVHAPPGTVHLNAPEAAELR